MTAIDPMKQWLSDNCLTCIRSTTEYILDCGPCPIKAEVILRERTVPKTECEEMEEGE